MSAVAARDLVKRGYTNVLNLDGGDDRLDAGRLPAGAPAPVRRDTEPVHASSGMNRYLDNSNDPFSRRHPWYVPGMTPLPGLLRTVRSE